jgi:hypothetical protein
MEKNKEITFQDAEIEDLREFLFDVGDSEALSRISGNIQDFQMFRWILSGKEKIGFYEYHYSEGNENAHFAGIYISDIQKRKEEVVDGVIMKAFENASQLSSKRGAKIITINSSRKGVINQLSDDESCELLSASFRKEL